MRKCKMGKQSLRCTLVVCSLCVCDRFFSYHPAFVRYFSLFFHSRSSPTDLGLLPGNGSLHLLQDTTLEVRLVVHVDAQALQLGHQVGSGRHAGQQRAAHSLDGRQGRSRSTRSTCAATRPVWRRRRRRRWWSVAMAIGSRRLVVRRIHSPACSRTTKEEEEGGDDDDDDDDDD